MSDSLKRQCKPSLKIPNPRQQALVLLGSYRSVDQNLREQGAFWSFQPAGCSCLKAVSSKLDWFKYGWIGMFTTCLFAYTTPSGISQLSVQWFFVHFSLLLEISFKKFTRKGDTSIQGLCAPLHLFFFSAFYSPEYFSKRGILTTLLTAEQLLLVFLLQVRYESHILHTDTS